jgi:calcium/calmodulin-dependent protein kinase I
MLHYCCLLLLLLLLQSLDHPNIARVQEVYHTPEHLYIIMDLYTGGEVFERYAFKGEASAAKVIRDVVNAVRYCHDRGIAVRDSFPCHN